jgi:hypothetical protein
MGGIGQSRRKRSKGSREGGEFSVKIEVVETQEGRGAGCIG